jgi:thiamine biosynthesis lipoprotein
VGFLFLAGPSLAAEPKAERLAVARAGKPVMGTVLEVTVAAHDRVTARRLADRAVAVAKHWDDVLTTWRPEGELARLNAGSRGSWFGVSDDLAMALRVMIRFAGFTDGAFDPAVGPLVERWRTGQENDAVDLLAGPIGEVLELEGTRARLADGAALDAGGIGKGVALDAMAAALRGTDAVAVFFDFGGSSQLAFGSFGDSLGELWVTVAGRRAGAVHGVLLLHDASLSTSRASGPGASVGPIIDPRSGRPVTLPRVATVLAADATTAEAWSTALVVLGRAGIKRAARAGVEVLLEDEQGVLKTRGFPLVDSRRRSAP